MRALASRARTPVLTLCKRGRYLYDLDPKPLGSLRMSVRENRPRGRRGSARGWCGTLLTAHRGTARWDAAPPNG
ncbi:hypothetical protein GCM10027444_38290 [Actinopolyspora lacussalsi]